MLKAFWQWLWSFVSPAHKAYNRAYTLYETYTGNIGLGLLGPTPKQVEVSRADPGLGEAEHLYHEALKLCREQGHKFNAAAVIYQLGLLKRLWGEPEQAIHLFEEAIEMFEGVVGEHPNARTSISMCHFYLGQTLLRAGRADDARRHLETAISLDKALGDDSRFAAAREMLQQCPCPTLDRENFDTAAAL
jgi:tetratricopeptide (TPR) repeat protein